MRHSAEVRSSRLAPVLPSILFLMVVVFFGIIPRLLLAPLLLRISADLRITYDQASTFFLTASAGFVTGLFTSGFVAQRITHRWTIFLSVLLGGVSLAALSRADSTAYFHIVLFVGGYANGLYPGSGIASVTTIAPDEHRGKALAIHESGPNLAFILAPILAAVFAPLFGWRGTLLLVGSVAVGVALLFAAFGRASSDRAAPPNFANLAELLKNPEFWVVSSLFIVAAIAAMGVYAALPTYLVVEHGLSEQLVNTLVGASRITGFAAIMAAGGLTDRFGFRKVVTTILVVTGVVTFLLGASSGTFLLVSVFLQPMIVGAYFPVGLNALAGVTAPARRHLAVALAIPLANLAGGGVAPPVLMAVGAAGHFRVGFMVTGVLVLAAIGLLPLMRGGKGRPRSEARRPGST
ncbi:MAG: MFS transporter [Spirochaetota bacterium]